MSAVTEQNGIKKNVQEGALNVSRIYTADYQKEGTVTAEIKQVITTVTTYPTKQVVTNLQDNIFSMDDFGFEQRAYENQETRVAWLDVPVGTTEEQVAAKLADNPKARIYKILSNRPILSSSQQYAIGNPEINVTLDTFAERQAVRYPEGHSQAGRLALDANAKIQYRAVFFSSQGTEDSDARTAEPSDFYASQSLKAEMGVAATIVQDQTI